MKIIDCHVHLVGDGSEGSGCWMSTPTLWKKAMAQAMLHAGKIPRQALHGKQMDRLYRQTLLSHLDGSVLDGLVLLAQDVPHNDAGDPISGGSFYVPNDYLFKVCAQRPGKLIPACSIHPARKDALAELDRCIERGAKVLKLLPNCLNVHCSDEKLRPFWKRMAEAKMLFLCHTGGETSVPVLSPKDASPETMRLPLECGVTCIAAHGAGRSLLTDPDYTPLLLAMFKEYPHLYADNSALCSPLRCRTVSRLLTPEAVGRVVYGSDWPIPISGAGPWAFGQITTAEWLKGMNEPNPLRRDLQWKMAMGFPMETFTRLSTLLA